MKIDLGSGTSNINSNGAIAVQYDNKAEKDYELSNINEDELIIEGFNSSTIHLKDITCQKISIKCFSPELYMEDIECDDLVIEHPKVVITNFRGKVLTVSSQRVIFNEIFADEINLYLNMEIYITQNFSEPLYFNCYILNAKTMNFLMKRRKDYFTNHSIEMNQVRINNFSLDAHGHELRIKQLSCIFKHTNIHLDLESILTDYESRQYMHINTLEAFAKCIFTPEEFKEVLKYHRHKPILK